MWHLTLPATGMYVASVWKGCKGGTSSVKLQTKIAEAKLLHDLHDGWQKVSILMSFSCAGLAAQRLA